jgi:hypothetical protein
MTEQEIHIQQLEEEFPSLSGSAFAAAFKQAREAGEPVVITENGALYEVAGDGSRKRIKDVSPTTPVPPGYAVIIS